jgi:Zn-finger nucleic acid-binding protein
MWFDRDELKLAKDSADEDLAWLDFDIFEDTHDKYSKKESNKTCPRDNSNLVTFTYSDSKISIEACSVCHGTWLDSEEFDKIIKYLEDKVVSETSGEYVKDLAHEFGEMLKRPAHLASEAKDFMAILRLFEKRLEAEHSNITYALSNFPIR